jgi:hypothetical protein
VRNDSQLRRQVAEATRGRTQRKSRLTDDVLDLIVEPRSVGKAKTGYHSLQGGSGYCACECGHEPH